MSVFSCKDTAQLISQSLDGRLSVGQRAAVSVHVAMCPMCARFRSQLLLLRDAARKLDDSTEACDANPQALSPAARERIERALEEKES